MRNLKRALSLGLTAAMISGLMVMGSSAAGFADVTSEQNQEAIEVLQAVGVMVGDDNGNFNPDQQVTRNEMAVVMSNLMDYRVANYAGTSPFTDVPSWAEPYVAACYINGITAGTSATTYGGSESVTAAQAALMMMKALGYFQYASDFENDWQLTTLRQASKIELFDGIDTAATEAMTRNDVAQIALNALTSSMVENDGEGQITVSGEGFTVTTGKTSYTEMLSTDKMYASIKSWQNYDSKYSVELGEKLYQGDLRMTGDSDAFGRPANVWSYEDDEIGTYVDDTTASWTVKVTEKDLYRAANSTAVNNYGWNIWVDGERVDYTRVGSGYDLDRNDTERWKSTGNGVLTEMFVNTLEETVDVTIINSYLAEVTKVEKNDDDYTVTVNFETKPNGSVSRQFNTDEQYAQDDIVVVGIAQGAIETMAKAETVEGTVNSVKSLDSVTVAGTPYNYNYAYTGTDNGRISSGLIDLEEGGAKDPKAGDDVTIYLDTNGTVVAVENASVSAEDYLYVKGTDEAYGDVSVKAVFYDGTEAKIDIDELTKADGTVIEPSAGSNVTDEGRVFRFEKSGDKYDLFAASTGNKFVAEKLWTDSNNNGVKDTAENGGKIENGMAVFGIHNGTSYTTTFTANSNTVFVDAYNNVAYTGYQNVPSMSGIQGYFVGDTAGSVADIVFITNDVEYEVDNDSFFFIKDTKATVADDDKNGKTWTYTVFVEGNEEQLVASSNLNDGANGFDINKKGLYKITKYDSKDFVTTIEPVVTWSEVLTLGTTAYATSSTGNVLQVTAAADEATGSGKTTFGINNETIYIVAEMNKANNDIDDVYAGTVSNIRATDNYNTGITGVYVLNVEDKDDSAPMAKLVLVVVPDTTAETADYTVTYPTTLPANITKLEVKAGSTTVNSGDSVANGTTLTITATPANTGYNAVVKVNGTPLVGTTFVVNGANVNITVEAQDVNQVNASDLQYNLKSSGNGSTNNPYVVTVNIKDGLTLTNDQAVNDIAALLGITDSSKVVYSNNGTYVTFTKTNGMAQEVYKFTFGSGVIDSYKGTVNNRTVFVDTSNNGLDDVKTAQSLTGTYVLANSSTGISGTPVAQDSKNYYPMTSATTITANDFNISTGYVKVSGDGISTDTIISTASAYTVPAKENVASAKGTGMTYTINGTTKYVAYGASIAASELTADVVLDQDYVKVTVAVSEDPADSFKVVTTEETTGLTDKAGETYVKVGSTVTITNETASGTDDVYAAIADGGTINVANAKVSNSSPKTQVAAEKDITVTIKATA